MTMVLKSGTSTLHASAWEFNRNDAFDARGFFNPAPGQVAKLRLNVFGFNVGGPVTLGKLYNPDKKKTFFFYNMEWRRLIQGNLNNSQTVPDPTTFGGQFAAGLTSTALHTPCSNQVSAATANQYTANGQTLSTADPTTGACSGARATLTPFTNNKIPTALLYDNAQPLLTPALFPKPTLGNPFARTSYSPTTLQNDTA